MCRCLRWGGCHPVCVWSGRMADTPQPEQPRKTRQVRYALITQVAPRSSEMPELVGQFWYEMIPDIRRYINVPSESSESRGGSADEMPSCKFLSYATENMLVQQIARQLQIKLRTRSSDLQERPSGSLILPAVFLLLQPAEVIFDLRSRSWRCIAATLPLQ